MPAEATDPLATLHGQRGVLVLDGGLATTLEARGHALDDELWSARVLRDSPQAIEQLHTDFLTAGADCIVTASYQASMPGFRKQGLSDDEGIELLYRSVQLALDARDAVRTEAPKENLPPLVAASIGPYGAYLADGSEYTGDYGVTDEALYDFHQQRWHILAHSDADLLACETLPSIQEVRLLLRLLEETPDVCAWMSFSCADQAHLSDGTPMVEAARTCDTHPRVCAVGINCTAPQHITSLIREIRKGTDKPILVYPNAGGRYDAARRNWAAPPAFDWRLACRQWVQHGAVGIGGCCRVDPARIAAIAQWLSPYRR